MCKKNVKIIEAYKKYFLLTFNETNNVSMIQFECRIAIHLEKK